MTFIPFLPQKKILIYSVSRKIFLLSSFLVPFNLFGQVRPDINDFSTTEKSTLVSLMLEYITPEVIQAHCNYDPLNTNMIMIHSDFDFLPFHRIYIQGMEDYLISRGYPEFVPLPKWDPITCTPQEFRVVDSDCDPLLTECNNGDGLCNGTIEWCPGVELPQQVGLPIQSGLNNDICDWEMDPIAPNSIMNCCDEGLSSQIENGYHNSVHKLMAGVMKNFRSPSAPIFWLWHAFVDDLWKSWEQNCPQSTTKSVDLWMADSPKLITEDRDRGRNQI